MCRHLNENGFISARPYAALSLLGMVVLTVTFFALVVPHDFHTEE